jgi:hypothetical protein
MPNNWFGDLSRQKQAASKSVTAVESVKHVPEDASPDQGWALLLTVNKITARLTVNGQTYYWLSVKDKMAISFTIVVWDYQYETFGPFEEGETREMTVKVPTGDYIAWTLFGLRGKPRCGHD